MERIESNLIIRTSLPTPDRKGFKAIYTELNKLEQQLQRMAKVVTISVKVNLDSSQLANLPPGVLSGRSNIPGGTVGGGGSAGRGGRSGGGSAGKGSSGAFANPSLMSTTNQVTQTIKDGVTSESTKDTTVTKDLQGRIQQTVTSMQILNGEVQKNVTVTKDESLANQKAASDAAKKAEQLKKLRTAYGALSQNITDTKKKANELRLAGFREDATKRVDRVSKVYTGVGRQMVELGTATRVFVKDLGNGYNMMYKLNEATGKYEAYQRKNAQYWKDQVKAQRAADKLAKEQAGRQKYLNNLQTAQQRGFKDSDFQTTKTRYMEKQAMLNGKLYDQQIRINRATGEVVGTTSLATKQLAAQERITKRIASLQGQAAEASRLTSAGYKEMPVHRIKNSMTGAIDQIRTFQKVSGNAFDGYQVQVARLNSSTGVMTQQLLQGTQAMKYLGDSFIRATAKVIMWVGATSAVFAITRSLYKTVATFAALEKGTVFLARVGRNLGGIGANFDEKLASARALTDGIIDLTTTIGGSAVEAQKAAAVYLRAGQTQEEALLSVKASLVAARIAELDIAESSALMNAAQIQFNLSATQLMPTLDSLNTLSNNYRVTTDDLLQSISRAGSVYADHSGNVEELSAVTAILAQSTGRSGTQIGNAIKTIQSRMDRTDLREELFNRLGVNLANASGESKSFAEVITELERGMRGLNESERNALEVNAAGIRQRNFLNTAIKQTNDILVAEIRSLRDHGSAEEEATHDAVTLLAAFDRLTATLVKFGNEGMESLGPLLKSLANVSQVTFGVASSFGGAIPKVVLYAGAFALLNRTVSYLLPSIVALKTQIATNFANSLYMANSNMLVVNSTMGQLRAAAVSTGKGMWQFFLGLLGGTPITMAATAAVIGLMYAMSRYAEERARFKSAEQKGVQDSETVIVNAEKRRRALKLAVKGAIDLREEVDRLNKSEGNTDRIDAQLAKIRALAKEFKEIARDFPELQGTLFPLGEKEVSPQATKAAIDAYIAIDKAEIKRIRESRRVKRDEAKAALADMERQLKEQEKVYRDLEDERKRFNIQPGDKDMYAADGFGKPLRNISAESQEAKKSLDKFRQSQQAATDELREAEDALKAIEERYNASVESLKRTAAAYGTLDQAMERLAATADYTKTHGPSESSYLGDIEHQRLELARYTADLINHNKVVDSLFKTHGGDFPGLDKQIEELNKLQHKVIDIQNAIDKARVTAGKSFVSDAAKDFAEFESALLKAQTGAARAQQKKPELTNPLAEIKDQQASAFARLQGYYTEIQRIQNLVSHGFLPKSEGDVRAAGLREAAQDQLNKLKKTEFDWVLAIKQAEYDIAEKRREQAEKAKEIAESQKKAADEAWRSVGALSEEDKLRFRAMANYFQKNPKAKVSTEQQLMMGSESNKVLNDYFAGHAETFTERAAKDRQAERMIDTGAGITGFQKRLDYQKQRGIDEISAGYNYRRRSLFRQELKGEILPEKSEELDRKIVGEMERKIAAFSEAFDRAAVTQMQAFTQQANKPTGMVTGLQAAGFGYDPASAKDQEEYQKEQKKIQDAERELMQQRGRTTMYSPELAERRYRENMALEEKLGQTEPGSGRYMSIARGNMAYEDNLRNNANSEKITALDRELKQLKENWLLKYQEIYGKPMDYDTYYPDEGEHPELLPMHRRAEEIQVERDWRESSLTSYTRNRDRGRPDPGGYYTRPRTDQEIMNEAAARRHQLNLAERGASESGLFGVPRTQGPGALAPGSFNAQGRYQTPQLNLNLNAADGLGQLVTEFRMTLADIMTERNREVYIELERIRQLVTHKPRGPRQQYSSDTSEIE